MHARPHRRQETRASSLKKDGVSFGKCLWHLRSAVTRNPVRLKYFAVSSRVAVHSSLRALDSSTRKGKRMNKKERKKKKTEGSFYSRLSLCMRSTQATFNDSWLAGMCVESSSSPSSFFFVFVDSPNVSGARTFAQIQAVRYWRTMTAG